MLDGVEKTATTNSSGQFTGDAIGSMTFNNGKGRIIPKKLPQKNMVFTISYNYGDGKSQTKNSSPDANNKLMFTIGTGAAIQPSSVGLEIPLAKAVGAAAEGVVSLHDVPINGTTGNLVDDFGTVMGTIIYATGACEVTPTMQKTIYTTVYTPIIFYTSG
jgi:hypothetical protein